MRRTPAALLALALAASGCAGMRASQAHAKHLQQELDALRYRKPLDAVWQEVRLLLAAQDFPLAGDDAKAVGKEPPGAVTRIFSPARETSSYREGVGLVQQLGGSGSKESPRGYSLDTGWRTTRDRVHADAVEDAGGVRVVLTRIEEDLTEHGRGKPSRDYELELALAGRLDPEAAAKIEASAPSQGR